MFFDPEVCVSATFESQRHYQAKPPPPQLQTPQPPPPLQTPPPASQTDTISAAILTKAITYGVRHHLDLHWVYQIYRDH
nr:hypothetical protein CFP56_06115 [Quercus suber]